MTEQKGESFSWNALLGMNETAAEQFMLKNWGRIPSDWNDPLFRDKVTGVSGQAELDAHMNFGEQAYDDRFRLGAAARSVWYLRNIDGQGHPAEELWLETQKSQ